MHVFLSSIVVKKTHPVSLIRGQRGVIVGIETTPIPYYTIEFDKDMSRHFSRNMYNVSHDMVEGAFIVPKELFEL